MLLFGELVPKRIAMQKPEPIARAISMVVYFLMRLFKPIVIVLTFTTNTVLRLFRIDPNKQENDVSEEEILYMVDVADEKGAIGRNEKEMIENIFEFNNMTAADIMIHRTNVEFLQLGSGDDEILEIIMDTGYSRFPVFNEDQDDIVGILMSRDFLINLQSKEKKSLQEIIRTAYFIPESVRTDILFKNMQSNNIHMAIVIDEYGGTSGLVTLEDLLEEIVGNIYDESDNYDEDEITNVDSQTWRISGSTEIETIAEQLNVQIPESDEYDTLAGLIINELSMIPTEGSTPIINAYGLEMKVESIKERRVESVLVKKISDIQLINHGDEKDLLNEP
jgi:putative hemolysin